MDKTERSVLRDPLDHKAQQVLKVFKVLLEMMEITELMEVMGLQHMRYGYQQTIQEQNQTF